MQPHSQRLIRALVVIAIAGLVFGVVLLSFPSQKETSFLDFSVFYCAGQIVRDGAGSRLYDLAQQFECQSQIAALHTLYPHPAFEALLYVPFTYFSYRTAYLLWTLFGMGILLLAAYLIESRTQVSLAISQYGRVRADLGLVYVAFLTFLPVTTCLLIGQDAILMLLVYTLVFVSLKRGKDFAAGCILACGLYKFQVVLPFAILLLLRRKWSALRGFAFVASILVITSVAIGGISSLITYPRLLLFVEAHQRQVADVPTLNGLLYLLTGGRFPPLWFWTQVALIWAIVLWLASRFWQDRSMDLSFANGVLATLLLTSHIYSYELTLLLLPVGIVCGELARRGWLLKYHALTAVLIVLFFPPVSLFLMTHRIDALISLPVLALFLITGRLIRSERPTAADALVPS